MSKKRSTTGKGRVLSAVKNAKKLFVCIALGVVLAIPIPFVNTAIGYAPLIAYLLLIAASFGYLKVLAKKLSFESDGVGDGCMRGEKLPFKLVVRNDSILPAVCVRSRFFVSDLFGGEGATAIRLITLPPRSTKTFDFGIRFDHIGTYTVGIQQIEVTDPFGIFSNVKQNPDMHEVHVQPLLHNVAGLQISTDATTESKKSFTTVINDGMDYSGVREYRWGDPIKAIHWKLSAGAVTDEYFTRLYETATNPGIEIITDFDNQHYDDAEALMCSYDALVESVFSIDNWCAEQGLESELIFVDGTDRTRRFGGPLANVQSEVIDRMPRISKGSGLAALDILGQEASSIYSHNNLVFCTSCITQELVGAVISAKLSRRNPILFAIIPNCIDSDQREEISKPLKRLGAAGIPYTIIGSASELGGYEA